MAVELDASRTKHGILPETGYCYTCGARLRYLHAGHQGWQARYYCCVEHMHERPPKQVLAEMYWGRPARDVALEALRAGRSVEAVAGILGVNKPTLYDWMRRWGIRRRVIWEVAS